MRPLARHSISLCAGEDSHSWNRRRAEPVSMREMCAEVWHKSMVGCRFQQKCLGIHRHARSKHRHSHAAGTASCTKTYMRRSCPARDRPTRLAALLPHFAASLMQPCRRLLTGNTLAVLRHTALVQRFCTSGRVGDVFAPRHFLALAWVVKARYFSHMQFALSVERGPAVRPRGKCGD